MIWFRMYHDVLSDPKLHRLPVYRRWRWVEVLCVASKAKERGKLPPMADLAFHMRVNLPGAESIMADLIRVGLVDELPDGKGLMVHDWDEHQKPSDSSADRVREYRERHRNVTSTGNVTLQTPLLKRDVTWPDSEGERDEENSLSPSLSSEMPAHANGAAPKPDKPTKISSDYLDAPGSDPVIDAERAAKAKRSKPP